MNQKPSNPLSGCLLVVIGSFVLLMLVLLLLKSCCISFIDAKSLSKRLAFLFTGIVFWVVMLTLLTDSKRQ